MSWKHLVIAAAALLVAGASVAFFWPYRNGPPTLHLPGVVEVQEVRLGSKVGGRVGEMCVAEGQTVQAGDVLVRFEVPETQAHYEQVQARLRQAELDLEKAKNGPRSEEKDEAQAVVEAARARLQRLKAGARPEEIRQARSELNMAEADLKLAREEFERVERTFSQGAAARAEWDSARAAYERSQARVMAVRARLDLLLAGNRPEEIEEAAADLRRAEARHRLLLAGTRSEDIELAAARVAELRAMVKEARASLDEAEVRATGRAVVEVVAVRPGDLVPPNQPVVRVLRAEDLWVKVYVPETELGKVRLNQPVEVTVDAYPNRRLAGTVAQIATISEFTPRNVQSPDERRHQVFSVKVRVDDPQGIFKSGMAAEVWLPLEESP